MSSHHSQKSVNLHHDQIAAGKARRLQRQSDRLYNFLEMKRQFRMGQNCTLVFSFICFAYLPLATAAYMWYIVRLWA